MDAIEIIEYKGYTIEIHTDDYPEGPCKSWDMFGTMVCWHRRYDLGHKNPFDTPQDAEEYFKQNHSIVLPLYLYDHSGLTMNTTGFYCPWDSGQVGYIYIDPEQVRKEYGVKRITKKIREKALECMRGEVRTYDMYLRGEVYGYQVKNPSGEEIDSCWGFYGDYNEDPYMIEQAKLAVDADIEEKRQQRKEEKEKGQQTFAFLS